MILRIALTFLGIFWVGQAWGAVSCSSPTNGTSGSTSNATSYTTGSISVTSGDLLLASVVARHATSPGTPTASNTGTAITWTQIAVQAFNTSSSPNTKITLFRGISSVSQSITITFDFAGVTHTSGTWSVLACSGVDTATNQGIVQSATDYNDSNSSTFMIDTLGAFSSTDNATAGFFGTAGSNFTFTQGSGFTATGTGNATGEANSIFSEFRADNDTTVDCTASGSDKFGGIAVEIKASTGGTPETTFMRRRRS